MDAILLTIENNLDIASARLLKPIAKSDQMRAAAGELLRNVPSLVSSGPSTAEGPIAAAGPSGFQGLNQSGVLSGLSVQLAGSQIPQLDPMFYATGEYSHTIRPEVNTIVEGTDLLVSQTQQWQAGVQKGFLTGTSVDLNMTGLRLSQNAPNNIINPAITADLALKIQQPILQGGSYKANSRAILIAKNNLRVADITFLQQATVTISEVLTLYYDLVTFRDQLELSKKALDGSRSLLDQNRKRMEMGLISQADVNESEASVSAYEQEVQTSQTQVEEQELTLKSVLTRKGLESPAILKAHVILTDRFDPEVKNDNLDLQPQEIAEVAIRQRPEVATSNIELHNKQLSLLGTREALKPTFNVYVELQTNALAGRLNRYVTASGANPAQFIGDYGTATSQLFRGIYPDYNVGFQMNVPLTNRAARADMMRDRIDLQQQEIDAQKTRNAIRLQALKSAFALRQARSEYKARVALRGLREHTLDTQQKMFELGTASIGDLMDAQRKLQLSRQEEISALNTYTRATINLDAVLNETLEHNLVRLEDAGANGAGGK